MKEHGFSRIVQDRSSQVFGPSLKTVSQTLSIQFPDNHQSPKVSKMARVTAHMGNCGMFSQQVAFFHILRIHTDEKGFKWYMEIYDPSRDRLQPVDYDFEANNTTPIQILIAILNGRRQFSHKHLHISDEEETNQPAPFRVDSLLFFAVQ